MLHKKSLKFGKDLEAEIHAHRTQYTQNLTRYFSANMAVSGEIYCKCKCASRCSNILYKDVIIVNNIDKMLNYFRRGVFYFEVSSVIPHCVTISAFERMTGRRLTWRADVPIPTRHQF